MLTNDEWQSELYFKRAQDAANVENYRLALKYYEHIIVTFSDMADKLAMANYEMGVLHFRLKNYSEASAKLVLVEEAMAQGVSLPDWLPVLTVMMRGNIDAKLNEASIKQATKEAKRAEKEKNKALKKAQTEAVARQAEKVVAKASPNGTIPNESNAPTAEPDAPAEEPDPEGWGNPDEWLD